MPARRDGCRAERILAAVALGRLRSDAGRLRPVASGALDDAHQAEVADAHRAGRRLDAAAEKLADREPDDRAVDGLRSAVLGAAVEARAPYKPGAGPSAARSFAGREPADAAVELELQGARLVRPELTAAHSRLLEEPQEHSPRAAPHAGLPELLEH